jgi:hypothetical protein
MVIATGDIANMISHALADNPAWKAAADKHNIKFPPAGLPDVAGTPPGPGPPPPPTRRTRDGRDATATTSPRHRRATASRQPQAQEVHRHRQPQAQAQAHHPQAGDLRRQEAHPQVVVRAADLRRQEAPCHQHRRRPLRYCDRAPDRRRASGRRRAKSQVPPDPRTSHRLRHHPARPRPSPAEGGTDPTHRRRPDQSPVSYPGTDGQGPPSPRPPRPPRNPRGKIEQFRGMEPPFLQPSERPYPIRRAQPPAERGAIPADMQGGPRPPPGRRQAGRPPFR